MKIYIPSRGRAALIPHGPLADMGPGLRARTILVVPGDEVARYKNKLANNSIKGVTVEGIGYRSIGEKRRIIGEMASGQGQDAFLMMDDDVRFFVRKSNESWHLRPVAWGDMEQMLAALLDCLAEVASAGVSSREGNNRHGVGTPEDLVLRDTRVMRVLVYRTKEFLACEHDRLPVMEDFDVQLQLLRAGLGNANLCYWANDQGQTNAPGGCSLWRTHALHEASAQRLVELHPGYVKLRQKANKTDAEGFGTRTEVTVAWKKAAEDGRK
jgi:hypothetical protein